MPGIVATPLLVATAEPVGQVPCGKSLPRLPGHYHARMARKPPFRVPPGPLSFQTAEALSRAVEDLYQVWGAFTATAPLRVRADSAGVNYSISPFNLTVGELAGTASLIALPAGKVPVLPGGAPTAAVVPVSVPLAGTVLQGITPPAPAVATTFLLVNEGPGVLTLAASSAAAPTRGAITPGTTIGANAAVTLTYDITNLIWDVVAAPTSFSNVSTIDFDTVLGFLVTQLAPGVVLVTQLAHQPAQVVNNTTQQTINNAPQYITYNSVSTTILNAPSTTILNAPSVMTGPVPMILDVPLIIGGSGVAIGTMPEDTGQGGGNWGGRFVLPPPGKPALPPLGPNPPGKPAVFNGPAILNVPSVSVSGPVLVPPDSYTGPLGGPLPPTIVIAPPLSGTTLTALPVPTPLLDGTTVQVSNVGPGLVTFPNQDPSAPVGTPVTTPTGQPAILPPGGSFGLTWRSGPGLSTPGKPGVPPKGGGWTITGGNTPTAPQAGPRFPVAGTAIALPTGNSSRLPGANGKPPQNNIVRLNPASGATLQGIDPPVPAVALAFTLVNASSNSFTLSNNSGSAPANGKVITPKGADVTVPANGVCDLLYDPVALVWNLLGDNFGAAAASGAGTVTTLSVTTANGVSGTVANPTSTPAITLTLGAITPTSVNGVVISSLAPLASPIFTGQLSYSFGSIAAAGNSQGSATAITADNQQVTGADGTKGVVLPAASTGARIAVWNSNVTNTLKVYPASGDQISNLGVNTSHTVNQNTGAFYIGFGANQWKIVVLS